MRATIPEEHDEKVKATSATARAARRPALILGAKVVALLAGRVNVSFADVEEIAGPRSRTAL